MVTWHLYLLYGALDVKAEFGFGLQTILRLTGVLYTYSVFLFFSPNERLYVPL